MSKETLEARAARLEGHVNDVANLAEEVIDNLLGEEVIAEAEAYVSASREAAEKARLGLSPKSWVNLVTDVKIVRDEKGGWRTQRQPSMPKIAGAAILGAVAYDVVRHVRHGRKETLLVPDSASAPSPELETENLLYEED